MRHDKIQRTPKNLNTGLQGDEAGKDRKHLTLRCWSGENTDCLSGITSVILWRPAQCCCVCFLHPINTERSSTSLENQQYGGNLVEEGDWTSAVSPPPPPPSLNYHYIGCKIKNVLFIVDGGSLIFCCSVREAQGQIFAAPGRVRTKRKIHTPATPLLWLTTNSH